MSLLVGTTVRIDEICESTKRQCGLTREMRMLRGTLQVVAWIDGHVAEIRGNDCSWSVDDLHPPEIKEPESKKAKYFDIKNLF